MPCPEGSFLAPEISRLFGDTVGASLVRGPGCQDRSCYDAVTNHDVMWPDSIVWRGCGERASRKHLRNGGVKQAPSLSTSDSE